MIRASAIPAMIDAAYRTRSRTMIAALALLLLIMIIELGSGVKIISVLYIWTAPAWFAWYFLALRIGP